jgi:ankyrin repeat protein
LTPLGAAIAADDPEWIDRLLKLGADVNYQGTKDDSVDIGPLSIACWKGHAPLVKRLLDLGADPNSPDRLSGFAKEIRQPTSTAKGWRPLHYAAGKPEIVAMLLAAGADAELGDAEGFTPLHAAAYLNAGKSCEALLKAGAACDAGGKLSWLVDKSRRNIPPPARAEFDLFPELRRLDNKEWTPIMFASAFAQQNDGGAAAKEVIQVLVEYGASLTPESLVSSSRNLVDICPVTKLRLWLSEIIHYPEFFRHKGITLAFPAAPRSRVLVADPEDASEPPSLAEALLSWVDPSWVTESRSYKLDRGFVRRIEENGQIQKIPFVVTDMGSHPELQWGDILEFTPVDLDAPSYVYPLGPSSGGTTYKMGKTISLDPKIYLELFSQMEVTVTILWPDRPRQQLLLCGGLRVYDPSRAEAPLVAPRALIKLLGGSPSRSLQITRSKENGGAIIELPKDPDKPVKGIRLLDGDVLTVGPLDSEIIEKSRLGSIQLLEPESGFCWVQRVPMNTSPREKSDKPAIYPTLFQFLTEFYLPLETFELESMSEVLAKEQDFTKWNPDEIADAVKRSGVAPWATIRHPDLREIWIDRHGGERIRVPLAELIIGTSEKTPDVFHRCREADLELRAGDIVEIRVLPNQAKVPWKGFDTKTSEFMQRALTYDFKIGDTLEDLLSRQVQWASPFWFETAAGPIAVSKTAAKPFVMDVNELEFGKDGSFKWGLEERWLREGVLIQPKRGRFNLRKKSRMGGSAPYLFFENHSGLDERGLLKSLRPRLIDPGTSSTTERVHPPVPRSRR